MTVYVAKFTSKGTLGTFKDRLFEYALESDARQVKHIGYSSWNDFLYLDGRKFSQDEDMFLILNNSSMKDVKFLIGRTRVPVVNPPQYREINKLDVWNAAVKNKIPTPKIAIGNSVKVDSQAILKPIRGEGGMGIRLLRSGDSIPPDYLAQEFIGVPANLGAAFDIRVYVLLGKFLGSTLRLTTETKKVDDKLFGISNTHQEGSMIYFEHGLLTRCPSELYPIFNEIRKWLGMKEPSTAMIEAATKISNAMNLTYCAVDFIFDSNKKWYVIDVNPNAMHGYRTKADHIRMKRAWDIVTGVS